jgi:glutamate--cysteine ligase
MQAIAGVHFNYSVNPAFWPVWRDLLGAQTELQGFINAEYFGLIRNVQRHGWLIPYLFGTSPAFCKSFFIGRESLAANFQALDAHSLYRPYATSLRMSDIGYRNDSQAGLDISLDDMDAYIASLSRAIATPYAAYERIGVEVNGEYRQLNTHILQIENEYYSAVRPKQVAQSCEKPTLALQRRGVSYIELRSVDINGDSPLGIDLPRMRFLELFLLSCLLQESPPLSVDEKTEISRNALGTACCGRTSGFMLRRRGEDIALRDWARELTDHLSAVAALLDEGAADAIYQACLIPLYAALEDPAATPSAQVLESLRGQGLSFQDYALGLSRQHAQYFRTQRLAPAQAAAFRHEAQASLAEQSRIEASDSLDFKTFLQRYFSQTCKP